MEKLKLLPRDTHPQLYTSENEKYCVRTKWMIPGLNQTSVENYLKNIHSIGENLTRFCHPTVLFELKRNQQKIRTQEKNASWQTIL